MKSSLLVQSLAAFPAYPGAPGTSAGDVLDMMRNPHGLVAARTNNHHVGNCDGAFALRDTTLDLLAGIRPRVALHHGYVLDQDPAGLGVHLKHPARFAAIPSSDHL